MLIIPSPKQATPFLIAICIYSFFWRTEFGGISGDFRSSGGDPSTRREKHGNERVTDDAGHPKTNLSASDSVVPQEEANRGTSMLRASTDSSPTTLKISTSKINVNARSSPADNQTSDLGVQEWIDNMVGAFRREAPSRGNPQPSMLNAENEAERGNSSSTVTSTALADAVDSSQQRNETNESVLLNTTIVDKSNPKPKLAMVNTTAVTAVDSLLQKNGTDRATEVQDSPSIDFPSPYLQEAGNLSWIEERLVPFQHWSYSLNIESDLDDSDLNESSAPLQNWSNIAFVHVGKSAGSTLSLLLRKGCRANQRRGDRPCPGRENLPNETIISQKVSAYFHAPNPPVDVHAHDKFLYVVRNPIDRIISEFYFAHPLNRNVTGYQMARPFQVASSRFFGCHNTIQQLADNLQLDQDAYTNFDLKDRKQRCHAYAWWGVLGKRTTSHHMYHNYFRYAKELLNDIKASKVNPHKEILVVRTEHIWDDWQTINSLLGGGEIVIPEDRGRDFSDKLIANNRTLTPKARFQLCRALRPEYQIYKQLLDLAMNLNEDDVATSVEEFRQTCGEAYLSTTIL